MPRERKRFKPLLYARRICQEWQLKSQPGDQTYIYNQGGYWQGLPAEYIEAQALSMMSDDVRTAWIKDIKTLVERITIIEPGKQFDDYNGHCNILTGMLDLETFELKDHDPSYLSRIQLPVNYVPGVRCPKWEKFLAEVLEEDSQLIDLFQEFIGYLLIPSTKYQKALILCGSGANGKSTAIQVIEALLGRHNVSNVALSDLSDEFHRVRLHGKLVNIATELDPQTLERSDWFKAIDTGDSISASHKHKPAFDFNPVCGLIFGCNQLPRVKDSSHASYRRLTIIPFNRRFEGDEADLDLADKLLTELDGIFMWALRGLHRLREQGRFTESEQAENELAEYRRFNNPLLAFIQDRCHLDAEVVVGKDTLFDAYKSYMEEGGYFATSKDRFFRDLYDVQPQLEKGRIGVDGQREQIVRGIILTKRI